MFLKLRGNLIYALIFLVIMKYSAMYKVDGGVSQGFGVKYPDQYEIARDFEAEPADAYSFAMKIAKDYADDALSNPETGKTVVGLVSLRGSNGAVEFDKKKAVVETSMLEHLLMPRDSEEKK